MAATHVLVLAKSPVPGTVKTRLCPPLTLAEAATVAEAALADTLESVAECGADQRILALDGPPGPWLPPGFEVIPQVRGPLGSRLAAAWEYAGGPGVQIGMDTPQVGSELLDHALNLITAGGCDALLGPAVDGGWWALGLKRALPGVFDGVVMSTEQTGADQYARLLELGLTVTMLPMMRDLDTATDARVIAAAAPQTRTARVVGSMLERTPSGGAA